MWWLLAACVHEVHVTTVPAGAMVTVGGKRSRVAPLDIKVATFRPVAITATLPGYRVTPAKVRAPLFRRAASLELRLVAEIVPLVPATEPPATPPATP